MKKIILMMSLLLLFVASCGKEFSVDVDGKGKVPKFVRKNCLKFKNFMMQIKIKLM